MLPIARLTSYIIYAAAILGMALLSGNEHDWMRAFDPSLPPDAIEPSGNRTIVAGLLLTIALTSQSFSALTSSRWGDRMLALALTAFALVFFLMTRLILYR